MQSPKLWSNLANKLLTIQTWDYRIAFCLAASTALVSALRISFNLGYNYGVFKSLDGNHLTCCVNFLESFLIPIAIATSVVAIGLWTKTAAGFLLSLFTTFCVIGLYVLWYLRTLSLLPRMEVPDFARLPNQGQHLVALLDASWWDLAVLAIICSLLVWEIKTLLTCNGNLERSV